MEPEALALLEDYAIPVPRHVLVQTEEEAIRSAETLGWPVVLKVVSPDMLHKTEMGAVALDLRDAEEVIKAFRRLRSLEKEGLSIRGILVCPFQPHDTELIVGMLRDPQFGPVITFGLGGIWVEVYRDVSYGIAPLSREESMEMMERIKAFSLLRGARGRREADLEALSNLLVRLSKLALQETSVEAIDLNPVFPLEKGFFIADARVILRRI